MTITTTSPDEALRRGTACAEGRGGRPDLIAAHRWFNVAALGGDERGATARRDVATQMTKAEIALALRGARESMARESTARVAIAA